MQLRLWLGGLFLLATGSVAISAPDFGPNVMIFDPSMSNIQQKIDDVFAKQEKSEFGPGRYALLFKPGKYDLDVQVGFGTQVMGLGASPDDVTITGAVRSKATWMHGNATINFWRAAENLAVVPTRDQNVNVWAVSQGTALRRVHIKGDLALSDHGWSSGGFLADSVVDGQVFSGTQQQWLARNDRWRGWRDEPGEWNLVFVGSENDPAGKWPEQPFTTAETTPVIAEKPYLSLDKLDYGIAVPPMQTNFRGTTWNRNQPPADSVIPIDRFFLAHPERDGAASINAALQRGMNVLLTPGIYHLDSPIRVTRPGTVIFGLGYPTLIAENGAAAMEIADVDGVRVCGLIVQAGLKSSPTLVQVGEPGSSASHDDPTILYDLFCRAGGPANGKADSFVTINSNNMIGDNWWLWRADHGRGAGWDSNTVRNGLIVNGKNVTMYGLFVEHCHQYQTVWNGEGGRLYFYQSEMPYDPPNQAVWSHDGVRGYASYKVADGVKTHQACGLGIYCVFFDAPVVAENAIETPSGPGIRMRDMVTVKFAGEAGSGIEHVINGRGGSIVHQKSAEVEK